MRHLLCSTSLSQYDIITEIHFGAVKAVRESVQKELAYYRNNVNDTIILLDMSPISRMNTTRKADLINSCFIDQLYFAV